MPSDIVQNNDDSKEIDENEKPIERKIPEVDEDSVPELSEEISEQSNEAVENEAVEAAKKNVAARNAIEIGRHVLRLRMTALVSITFCMCFFFLTALSGISLYLWYVEKLIVKGAENFQGSSSLVLFVNENISFIQGVHISTAFLTIVMFVVYMASYINFHKLYTETPLPGKTRKPSRVITSTVGLALFALAVLNLLTGFSIPSKESTLNDFEKTLSTIDPTDKTEIMTLEKLKKTTEKAELEKFQEADKNKTFKGNSALLFHIIVLPVLLGILMLVLLIDVYSLQKSKLALEKKKSIKQH